MELSEKWRSIAIGAFSAMLSGIMVSFRKSRNLTISRLASLETSLPFLKDQYVMQNTLIRNEFESLRNSLKPQFVSVNEKIDGGFPRIEKQIEELRKQSEKKLDALTISTDAKFEKFEKKIDTLNAQMWEIKLLLLNLQANHKESPQNRTN